MAWEVQHYTMCDGWVNTWTETTDSPEGIIEQPCVFDTEEEAQTALREFQQEVEQDIETGMREPDEGFDFLNDFRIVEVRDA